MGRGPEQAYQMSRLLTMLYRGASGKELERCMAISPVTPFFPSSSQYAISSQI